MVKMAAKIDIRIDRLHLGDGLNKQVSLNSLKESFDNFIRYEQKLYLMDTDIEINDSWHRGISARLYTGDLEQRLRQEVVLGIGGAEVLEVLGLKPFVLHLNEGHAAFALLEQIRDRIGDGMNYQQASKWVGKTSVFTTHTPVPAGHDVFPFYLMEKYFRTYWPCLKLDRDEFLKYSSGKTRSRVQHDGAGPQAVEIQQCGQSKARRNFQPDVAVSVAGCEG